MYGKVRLVTSGICPTNFRIDEFSSFNAQSFEINENVHVFVLGSVITSNFTQKARALVQGFGLISATTGTIEGDIAPGYLFDYFPAGFLDCGNCAPTWKRPTGLSLF